MNSIGFFRALLVVVLPLCALAAVACTEGQLLGSELVKDATQWCLTRVGSDDAGKRAESCKSAAIEEPKSADAKTAQPKGGATPAAGKPIGDGTDAKLPATPNRWQLR